MKSELEILEEPNYSKRQLDEIREFIFTIKSELRKKKELGWRDCDPMVINIKPKREETLKTLQQFISYESRDSYSVDVDGEVFTLKDFAFENKNIYLIFKKDMESD